MIFLHMDFVGGLAEMDVIHEVCWKIGLYLCMAIRMGCGGRCAFVDGGNDLYGTDRDDIRV